MTNDELMTKPKKSWRRGLFGGDTCLNVAPSPQSSPSQGEADDEGHSSFDHSFVIRHSDLVIRIHAPLPRDFSSFRLIFRAWKSSTCSPSRSVSPRWPASIFI